jgi:hypothetical protein
MNNGARWIFTTHGLPLVFVLNILLLLIIYAIGQIGISIYLHVTMGIINWRWELHSSWHPILNRFIFNNYSLFKQELHGFYWSHLCFALAALALNNIIFYLCWERSSSNPIFIPSYVRWPLITTMVVFTLL